MSGSIHSPASPWPACCTCSEESRRTSAASRASIAPPSSPCLRRGSARPAAAWPAAPRSVARGPLLIGASASRRSRTPLAAQVKARQPASRARSSSCPRTPRSLRPSHIAAPAPPLPARDGAFSSLSPSQSARDPRAMSRSAAHPHACMRPAPPLVVHSASETCEQWEATQRHTRTRGLIAVGPPTRKALWGSSWDLAVSDTNREGAGRRGKASSRVQHTRLLSNFTARRPRSSCGQRGRVHE